VSGQFTEQVICKLTEMAFAEAGDARPGDRLRALELLGKHYGLFKEAEATAALADDPLAALLAAFERYKKRRRTRRRAA